MNSLRKIDRYEQTKIDGSIDRYEQTEINRQILGYNRHDKSVSSGH